jgi:hypothetical protein
MKYFFSLIVLLALSSCTNFQDRLSYDEKLANECLKKAAIQLKKKKGLHLFGTGGRMMDQIKVLHLSFIYYKPIDIKEGRELLIASVNELIDVVNASEHIRPYLNNYPFEPKNIGIEIFLRNPDGSFVAPEQLRVISAEEGILSFKIDNPETRLFQIVHKETYEEALLKINTTVFEKSA